MNHTSHLSTQTKHIHVGAANTAITDIEVSDAILTVHPQLYDHPLAPEPSIGGKIDDTLKVIIPSSPITQQMAEEQPPMTPSFQLHLAEFFYIVLPLSLVVAVVTADMSNLEFVHLVSNNLSVPLNDLTLPADPLLNANNLRWTFLQSAYLLPIMLLAGPILILQFVLLVGRLGPARLVDGVNFTLVLSIAVVGLTTLLNAFVGTSLVGVVLIKMLGSIFVCSTLGVVAMAVGVLDAQRGGRRAKGSVGFPTVLFGVVYGLGTAFASCSTFGGYQIAGVLQRNGITFEGIGGGRQHGFSGLFLVEGVFILALCPVVGALLMLSRRLRHPNNTLEALAELDINYPTSTAPELGKATPEAEKTSKTPNSAEQVKPQVETNNDLLPNEESKHEKTTSSTLRRLSSSPLFNIAILTRNSSGTAPSSTRTNLRSLHRLHTGFGLWVSSLLRRIMVFVYGRMGVDSAAFDLISAGTSCRETFICGVLIVSNTVIIQLAVISLIAPLKSPASSQIGLDSEWKRVPALPGLPTLLGGVGGAISSVSWCMLATSRSEQTAAWRGKPWCVPALLSTCLVITLAGLALAVVASIMVPEGDCGVWIVYAATVVTYAGSTPQLPLALLQVYTVLDAELGRNAPQQAQEIVAQSSNVFAAAARSKNASVTAIRWERIGVMISTLTTIAGSQLLTAWVFLMPDAAQKTFLFTSAVLAIGGSVWLMFRHTWPLRKRRKLAHTAM